jgi:hypothetical protein
MWIKFARQPWCRMKSLQWPVSLHFPAPDRRNWTPEQRTEELRHWTKVIGSPDYAVRIWRDILPDLGSRLLSRAVSDQERKEFIARATELEAEVAAVRDAAARQIADFQRMFDATREAADERIRQLENQLDALAQAAAAQVLELQTMFGAERSAAIDRIRELERRAEWERNAMLRRAEWERNALLRRAEWERNAILSSTSWRITAPLRWGANWLRRLWSG